MSYYEFDNLLPPIPTQITPQSVEVTENCFVVWDNMNPWEITGIGMVKMEKGGIVVYTPGDTGFQLIWRGEIRVSSDSITSLISWLQNNTGRLPEEIAESDSIIKMDKDRIMIYENDGYGDSGFGIFRDSESNYELTFIGAGLRRGGARMNKLDGERLFEWLNTSTE